MENTTQLQQQRQACPMMKLREVQRELQRLLDANGKAFTQTVHGGIIKKMINDLEAFDKTCAQCRFFNPGEPDELISGNPVCSYEWQIDPALEAVLTVLASLDTQQRRNDFVKSIDELIKNGVAKGCYQDYQVLAQLLELLSCFQRIVKGASKDAED